MSPIRISADDIADRVADHRVEDMRRAEHGELEATVVVRGERVPVSRRCGSWQIPRADGHGQIDVVAPYSFELAKAARRFEGAERR